MKIPTMNKMIKVYADAATIERLKCGRPTERTVRNILAGYKIFRAWLNSRRVALGYESIGMDEDFPLVSIIKPVSMVQQLMGESNKLPDLDAEIFDALNRQVRTLGFIGTKGAYELRKICIDHVYQRFGAEMATSISGDNIRTILHYYADPVQPNIGEIRVTDLL